MNDLKKILLATFLMAAILGCKKEGCTYADAENYSADAEKDDGSCTFKIAEEEPAPTETESTVIFYWDESVSNDLFDNQMINEVFFYIEETLMGKAFPGSGTHHNGSIDCSDSGVHRSEFDLDGETTSFVTYRVTNADNGNELWSGTVELDYQTCTTIKLN